MNLFLDELGRFCVKLSEPYSRFREYFIYKYKDTQTDLMTGKDEEVLIPCPVFETDILDPSIIRFPTDAWVYPFYTACEKFEILSAVENQEFFEPYFLSLEEVDKEFPSFYHAWEPQIEVLREILRYRRGMVNLRTGYGKSTLICILAQLFLDRGYRVFVGAPKGGVVSEIFSRFKRDFNYEESVDFNLDKKLNFFNPKGLFRRNATDLSDPRWKERKTIVLLDEAEDCMSPMFLEALYHSMNPERVYLFSGSINKYKVGPLEFESEAELFQNQVHLLNVAGHTPVYQKPLDRDLEIIQIKDDYQFNLAGMLHHIGKPFVDDPMNDVPIMLMSEPEYSESINWLFRLNMVPNLLIPVVSRKAMTAFCRINKERKIGLIHGSGSGFQYRLETNFEYQYDEEGKLISDGFIYCTLDELKEKMVSGEVDLVLTSSSGFAGIDFPNTWAHAYAFMIGKWLNRTVQAPGRVSRAEKFHLIYRMIGTPGFNIYNKHVIKMIDDMEETYKDGTYKRSTVHLFKY